MGVKMLRVVVILTHDTFRVFHQLNTAFPAGLLQEKPLQVSCVANRPAGPKVQVIENHVIQTPYAVKPGMLLQSTLYLSKSCR